MGARDKEGGEGIARTAIKSLSEAALKMANKNHARVHYTVSLLAGRQRNCNFLLFAKPPFSELAASPFD